MALGDPGAKQGPPGRSLRQPPQARIYRSLPSAAEADRGQPSPERGPAHHPLASVSARARSPCVREEELLQPALVGARFANAEPAAFTPRGRGPLDALLSWGAGRRPRAKLVSKAWRALRAARQGNPCRARLHH